ncbi:MAG: AAA family ATPase [Shewanella sp.]|nr:AAA family ATPase [Shewanella sp.]MCF1431103.1 AAA family ATPase [Shewanella sp.]MCF1458930.1 AAA family ATPase [Shewanella sp.]
MAITTLSSKQVYRDTRLQTPHCDCLTTDDLVPLDDIIGQQRARQAVEFAMSIKDKGYNIYAIGENGLGKRTMMLRYLSTHPTNDKNRQDWCYVANFDDSRQPKVLSLPAGSALNFKKAIENLMKKLAKALPMAFDNEMYYSRAEKRKGQLAARQEEVLSDLAEDAKNKHISLSISSDGDYQLVALNGDEPHSEETYDALSAEEQTQFETDIKGLETKLRRIVRDMTDWEEEYSDQQQAHDEQVAKDVLKHYLQSLKKQYKALPAVIEYLGEMQKDILDNLDIFLEQSDEQLAFSYASLDKKLPRRYQVNVLVSSDEENFPVVVEGNPNYHSLFGYVENATYKGTVFTDFSLIRAGSLHRANGGVLMMDAVKVLERPYVWDGLKRALRSRQLDLSSLEREVTLSGAISLSPEPIPLDVKIVLFGDRHTYQLLQQYDPDFGELFKVTADFENVMARTDESEVQFARFIASIVQDNQMLPCERSAMERIIEFSARQADNQNKLSLYSADVANLLRETNYYAGGAGAQSIEREHVEKALDAQRMRVSRLQDTLLESFTNGTTLIDVTGEKVGQINALSVLSTTDHEFGLPNRITASTAYGKGEVLDIEHKVRLGGQIHSKGVYILTAFLAARLGKSAKIPLTMYLTFEQSYAGVDGDSASMAECCAIMSAISGVPLKQDIAITGSMNQFGEVQPIGGVNEKIEGFFDVCCIKGREPGQGVIIPESNRQNLMLRRDIVDAIDKGEFHIWTVNHVTEAASLLTGTPAEGELSTFSRAERQLKEQRLLQKKQQKSDDHDESASHARAS